MFFIIGAEVSFECMSHNRVHRRSSREPIGDKSAHGKRHREKTGRSVSTVGGLVAASAPVYRLC